MYKNVFKRLIDLILALLAVIFLLPVFLILFILLLIANDGKAFFFQARPGKHGKIFRIVKFRTMNERRDSSGELLPDDVRLTAIGAFIRKTSLDEIPQLINVLLGDMSIVGPRPLLVEYLPLYNEAQRKRHEVRPGITGLAQVNGRNAISWNRKFELDIEYVNKISFLLDVRILFLTIKKVYMRDGISQEGQATMEVFNGKN